MGWASGSDVACNMIRAIRDNVQDSMTRSILYQVLLDTLEAHDWDTVDEGLGIDTEFDNVVFKTHPDWREYE